MKFRPCLRPLSAAALLALCQSPLPAQTLNPEQIQTIRENTDTAGKSLSVIVEKSAAPDVRQEAETARAAVGKISEVLQKSGAVATPEDPYKGGKKYPPIAGVKIESFDVPAGATEVHVPVTLDKASPNTVIAHVRVYDGEGGRADPDTTKAVIFYPGDPLTKTATFAVRGMSEGATLRAVQPHVPDGAERKGGGIVITAKAEAVNEPITGGREPAKFEPLGTLSYSATGERSSSTTRAGPTDSPPHSLTAAPRSGTAKPATTEPWR